MDKDIIEVSFQKFQQVWPQVKKQKKCICIFTSEILDGKWDCSDCQIAHPKIHQFLIPLAKKNNLPVYSFSVGDFKGYKQKTHKFRTHPDINLKSIPTIGLWQGKFRKKLQQNLACDQTLYIDLIQ